MVKVALAGGGEAEPGSESEKAAEGGGGSIFLYDRMARMGCNEGGGERVFE